MFFYIQRKYEANKARMEEGRLCGSSAQKTEINVCDPLQYLIRCHTIYVELLFSILIFYTYVRK